MFRTIAGCFILVVLTSPAMALAADEIPSVATIAANQNVELAGDIQALRFEAPKGGGRGSVLPSLYLGLAGLNAYDAYTTLKAVSRGATEANAVIAGAARMPAAMWALKGGVTAGSVFASERLWRSGRRAQAIGMMVASNVVMAMVGAHNNSVLRRQR